MKTGSDRVFNELLQEVQHQFIWYIEESSKKFQKLDELLDLATQKMAI